MNPTRPLEFYDDKSYYRTRRTDRDMPPRRSFQGGNLRTAAPAPPTSLRHLLRSIAISFSSICPHTHHCHWAIEIVIIELIPASELLWFPCPGRYNLISHSLLCINVENSDDLHEANSSIEGPQASSETALIGVAAPAPA